MNIFPVQITSDFSRSGGEWNFEEEDVVAPVTHDQINKLISVKSDRSGAYFLAPGILRVFYYLEY